MTEPFIGEIQILGFSYPPYGWAFANGSIIPIRQSTTLYALIGTTYGGDGSVTFQLPNLSSRQACGSGQGAGLSPRPIGSTFGSYDVTLDISQMPMHNHGMNVYPEGSSTTATPTLQSGIGAPPSGFDMYTTPQPTSQAVMNPNFVQSAGAGQPHTNAQPYLGLNYSIALQGSFPYFD